MSKLLVNNNCELIENNNNLEIIKKKRGRKPKNHNFNNTDINNNEIKEKNINYNTDKKKEIMEILNTDNSNKSEHYQNDIENNVQRDNKEEKCEQQDEDEYNEEDDEDEYNEEDEEEDDEYNEEDEEEDDEYEDDEYDDDDTKQEDSNDKYNSKNKNVNEIDYINNNISTYNDNKLKKKRGRKPKIKNEDEIKIPKKRGRKPKIKEFLEEKIPKKRGRKPKDKIYSVKNIDKLSIVEENVDTLILHLPIKSKDIENNINLINNITEYSPEINIPEPYEPECNVNYYELQNTNSNTNNNRDNNSKDNKDNKCKNENKNFEDSINKNSPEKNEKMFEDINYNEEKRKNNNEINNYETNQNLDSLYNFSKNFIKNIYNVNIKYNNINSSEWIKSTNLHCMWCCHKFTTPPIPIPEKYIDDKFHVYGIFCSFNCASSYIFKMEDDYDRKFEKYNLLNLLYKKVTNNNNKIKLAPDKEVLKIFGGNLSIEDFRKSSLDNTKNYNIQFPPLVTIIPKIEETIIKKHNIIENDKFIPIDNNLLDNAKKTLRLKRNKPITDPESTLYSYMDLKIV